MLTRTRVCVCVHTCSRVYIFFNARGSILYTLLGTAFTLEHMFNPFFTLVKYLCVSDFPFVGSCECLLQVCSVTVVCNSGNL